MKITQYENTDNYVNRVLTNSAWREELNLRRMNMARDIIFMSNHTYRTQFQEMQSIPQATLRHINRNVLLLLLLNPQGVSQNKHTSSQ